MSKIIFPRISTRGYYDLSSGRRIKDNSYFLYPKKYFDKLHTQEFTIMIHGLRNDKAGALTKFIIAQRRLRQIKYRWPVIGYSYDSNTKGAHLKKTALHALHVGEKIAKQNGNNLAKFILDFKKENPSLKIRLIGHSLGSQVILSTILALNKKNIRDIIESVALFGASIPADSFHPKKYGKQSEKVVRQKIRNYYSPTDEVLKIADEWDLVKLPIGLRGAAGKTIQKYSQSKVKPKNHRFVSYSKTLYSYP